MYVMYIITLQISTYILALPQKITTKTGLAVQPPHFLQMLQLHLKTWLESGNVAGRNWDGME